MYLVRFPQGSEGANEHGLVGFVLVGLAFASAVQAGLQQASLPKKYRGQRTGLLDGDGMLCGRGEGVKARLPKCVK